MGFYRSHSVLQRKSPKHIKFWLIYVLSIVFNFHGLLVAYSNSTFMERFVSPEAIGALYTISSCIAVFAFLFISRILRKIGNVKLTLALAFFEMLTLIVLGFTASPATAIVAFVVFMILNPLLYLNIDIFSEKLIGSDEESTGSKRGLTLMLMSIAALCAPLALGIIVGDNDDNLSKAYLVAAGVALLFMTIIITQFHSFKDPEYSEIKVLSALRSFWVRTDIRNVFFSHFTLQVFFSWTVIYFPLYLATEIGFTWDIIGYIIATGLFAYVLFEFPIGIIADKYIGEKEMMAVGFVILAVSSSWITFMADAPVVSWMILMFISRVGASLVEATTESYFFKHTDGGDANIISFFRLSRPLAMIVGALMGSVTLLYLPFELIFVALGFAMIPGIFFTMKLKDTK